MIGFTASDGDLTSLHGLESLRIVSIPNYYSLEQLSPLSGALPKAQGFGLAAVVEYHRREPCAICGCATEAQLIGRRRGAFVCAECDAALVARHVENFIRFRDEQRNAR